MKSLKNITLTLLLSLFIVISFATTWAPIYAYTQKTEKGKVKSTSIPYGVYDGGYGPGETSDITEGEGGNAEEFSKNKIRVSVFKNGEVKVISGKE